ncbi:MAG: sulfurtransferase TusA family protein [Candidatus Bathyarchaeia archaeon]
MNSEFNPTKTLDVKGFLCPIPVIKAKKAIEQIPSGSVLMVQATDPAAESDITVWTKRAGHELLKLIVEGDVLTFYVRKQ